MNAKKLIKLLLDKRQLPYTIIKAPDAVTLTDDWQFRSVPPETLAQAQLLHDANGIVLAIYPASYEINLAALNLQLRRKLTSLSIQEAQALTETLNNLEATDPAGLLSIGVIVDEHLSAYEHIYTEANESYRLIQFLGETLNQLSDNTLLGSSFSDPSLVLTERNIISSELNMSGIKHKLGTTQHLPVIPETARQLLRLRNNRNGTVEDLSAIIHRDPVLAAYIIRYANSAIFGQREAVKSIEEAIFRVLGYEAVLYQTLGSVIGKALPLPKQGKLGREQFWKQSYFAAALSQRLALQIPKAHRPHVGLAYLCGLLHDIGILVLAGEFRTEYDWLNNMLSTQADTNLVTLEQFLLRTHHGEVGSWLLDGWNLPDEVSTVSRAQHAAYQGKHQNYVQLIQLVDKLLSPHQLSYINDDNIPAGLLTALHLDEEGVYTAVDDVLQGSDLISEMASAMSA